MPQGFTATLRDRERRSRWRLRTSESAAPRVGYFFKVKFIYIDLTII
ncbi:MAG: hypothetical protein ACHBN1_15775 [Heteroscytonema crispum UTEX LB 1556]